MKAIEFETDYKSGVIKIPDIYNIKSNSHLRVIVLYNEESIKNSPKDILIDITNRFKEVNEDDININDIYEMRDELDGRNFKFD